jgi:hypothetical protein
MTARVLGLYSPSQRLHHFDGFVPAVIRIWLGPSRSLHDHHVPLGIDINRLDVDPAGIDLFRVGLGNGRRSVRQHCGEQHGKDDNLLYSYDTSSLILRPPSLRFMGSRGRVAHGHTFQIIRRPN